MFDGVRGNGLATFLEKRIKTSLDVTGTLREAEREVDHKYKDIETKGCCRICGRKIHLE